MELFLTSGGRSAWKSVSVSLYSVCTLCVSAFPYEGVCDLTRQSFIILVKFPSLFYFEEFLKIPSDTLFLGEEMPYHSVLHLVLLMLSGVVVPAVLRGKHLCLDLRSQSTGNLLLINHLLPLLPHLFTLPKRFS